MRVRRGGVLWIVVFTALIYVVSVAELRQLPAKRTQLELETALPMFIQVVLVGGDRFLAANLGVFAVLTSASSELSPEKLSVQADIQDRVAVLNNAHEDNYYLAAAALSWGGEVEKADRVLARAVEGRPYDFVPPFFLGFNHFHFLRDPLAGANWMRIAAARADDEHNRLVFEKTAARWIEKGSGPSEALRVLEGMQKMSRSQALRQHLQLRIDAMKSLIRLREAGAAYKQKYARIPRQLEDLQSAGLIRKLPKAPQGQRFTLDSNGEVVLVQELMVSK